MKVLGCTGGIGSGKSYVSALFSKMGIPVYDSDSRTKALYDTDVQLRSELVDLLGEEILVDGVLQRSVMAAKVFGSKELLTKLEEIVHPAVVRDFCRWKEGFELGAEDMDGKAGMLSVPPFVIMESAIIMEKPLVKVVADKMLTVAAPLELRIERVMARDNVGREKVLERMAAQWSDEQREANADFIIFADGKHALLPQIHSVFAAMTK